jgi:prephenate dehydrogenase
MSADEVHIERLCVVGVGLIGGSLVRDLRRQGVCSRFVGCSRSEENLRRAVELGVVDEYHTDLGEAVRGCDVVLVAVPLGAMRSVFDAMAGHLDAAAIVTDVGSAKGSVIADAVAALGGDAGRFVPAHPIAGTENSGVEASIEGLYRGRRVILTPTPATDPAATRRVRAIWEAVGAEVVEMEPRHHDEVLAATSHLPPMLAYTLVDALGRMEDHIEIFRYAAGGFRDFTRIASSDPQMWHDICLANRDALVTTLGRFRADLEEAMEAIRSGDSDTLKALFVRAKTLRDRYVVESER